MSGLVASSAQNVQLREQRLEVEWDLASEKDLVRDQTERFSLTDVEWCMKRIKNLVGSFAFIAALSLSRLVFGAPSEAELIKEAKISKGQAEKTAINKVPHGVIKSGEIEREHGRLIWSFDISTPQSSNITEVQVDAMSGKIVSTQVETVRDQAKESAAEKTEKK